jgi:hypothetical protein
MLMGDTTFGEYVRIAAAADIPENVYLQFGNNISEVSRSHFLLCVEPMVFGVWFEKENWHHQSAPNQEYHLYFGGKDKPEAVVTLRHFDRIDDDQGTLLLLQLQKSRIYHLASVKNFLIYYRYYRRDGMRFKTFKSHVCAYSYPRRIRIISFRQDDYYNIFPMDLLGDISQHNKYVLGLRHSNVTLKRILDTGKILVAEAPSAQEKTIFQLGNHHSSQAPAISELPFGVSTSKRFGFYVPGFAESYKEIKIVHHLNLGSHMLLWGEVQEEIKWQPHKDHLYMVHFLHFLHLKNKGILYHRL